MAYKRPKAQLLNTSRLSAKNTLHDSIRVHSVFEARVKSLADTGNAVVNHPSGLLFFVVGAWVGELIKVQVLEVKSKFGLGELVEVLEPSKDRVKPLCPFQGHGGNSCGGCSWMFVGYEAQLAAKQERIRQAIRRFDDQAEINPILAAENPLGYRVRAQFKTNGNTIGFVANASRSLVAIDDCLILTKPNRETLAALNAQLPNKNWQPSSVKKDWTTLDIDEGTTAEAVNVNKRLPFQQANAQQNQVIQSWLLKIMSGLDKQAKVLELFAGSGNFTRTLSQAGFNNIVAVEVVDDAVSALRSLRMPGVTAVTANLFREESFDQLLKAHKDSQVLVLDPPRDGLKVKTGLFQKGCKIRDIVYVSCDLATLCRDLREFKDHGYRILHVQALDLMPQTPHVEILTHLRKGK